MTFVKTGLGLALLAAATFSLPAHAAPIDLANCLETQITPNADDCAGYYQGLNTDGNADDMEFLADVLDQWGLTTTPEYKDDNTSDGTSTTALFDAYALSGGGGLELLAGISGPFAIAVKAGSYLGLYYFEGSFETGQVFTFSVPDMILPGVRLPPGTGLSHVSIFGGTTSVPEPGALALLGLGLLGLGLSRRRKSA